MRAIAAAYSVSARLSCALPQVVQKLCPEPESRIILSTRHSHEFRTNATIGRNWQCPGIHLLTREHFYHIGSSEDLRHPMAEALITNYAVEQPAPAAGEPAEQMAFFERA
jgi:hypothetical protein